MNTRINYHYDAAGTKAYAHDALHGKGVIVAGELNETDRDEIRRICEGTEFFIAGEVGLPELQSVIFDRFGISDDDHVFHFLTEFESTSQTPTIELTAEELLANFRRVGDWRNWDVSGAMERLKLS